MKNKFSIAMSLAVILAMLLTSVVLADQVVNNIDITIDSTPEVRTITVGGSTTVGFFIQPSNTIPSGDASGCNATGSTPAIVNLNIPANVTASATSLTFSGCGVVQNVTFSSSAANISGYTISVSSVTGGKSGSGWDTSTADFKLVVNPPANTAPSLDLPGNITEEATSAAGAVVNYTASAIDAEDNPDPTPTCLPASGATFPLGTTTVNCSVTDSGGLSASGSFTVTVRDTTAPALSLPGNIVAEATSAAGASVSYTASATDLVDGPVAINCSPVSGSTFALGTTLVNCSATDSAGNTASASFSVTVRDTTPPQLTLPSNMTVSATSAAGAVVIFNASASDLVDGSVAVTCTPASGSIFAPGTTTVNCSATDAAGNTASGSFTVSVKFQLLGFYQPVDMGIFNNAKGGSTVPLKFEVFAGATELTTTSIVQTFQQKLSCSAGTGDDIESYATGSTSLRYDTTGGQFIFNWQTPKAAGSCYRVTLTLSDGTSIHADFKLK